MTDIFFSYSSADRDRVRPVRDALVAQGFEVFWDQEVPSGLDWDSWIRQHLAKSKCAMAFWSAASVVSDNVRHEAMVAKQQGKLISVLLESLTIHQFPMGLYAQQAANLADWNGDPNHNEWRKLRREFEAKLTPAWVRRQIDELGRVLIKSRSTIWIINVRFGPLCGLKSDISRGPRSANSRLMQQSEGGTSRNEALVDLRRLYRPPKGAGLSEPGSGRREVVEGGLGVAACGAGRAGNRGPC